MKENKIYSTTLSNRKNYNLPFYFISVEGINLTDEQKDILYTELVKK
ncbi:MULTISPECIES: hypothetical protein [unclassified Clostridioides]|nr:hypothetical protein [Clostridioides sp. ES-S-0145-01]MCC0681866.1 hypothetical protein [Clostridioides sp. ES-S-0005-03]MCC0709384.1 hypothetical protein [Clostridioides sp. ES-S-0190-01]UDN64061.1 hypothetical protein IC758_19490 [Clostridioides sp. ES-W-0016-02]